MGPAREARGAVQRSIECKEYHRPRTANNPGRLRSNYQTKSRCPSWAADPVLQQRLIDEALEDAAGATDSLGRPKRLWNAVGGNVFVGVSCNLPEPRYNCYLEEPPDGRLFAELRRRAERTTDEVLGRAVGH